MSIITIEKENVGSKSIDKTIDAGAQALVFDILQRNQYTKPIESTIRETVSNAIDAIKEKTIAKEIIKGTSKPEDYFIKREGAQYEDSNWNSTYYDLNFLSDDDKVEIVYKKNDGVGFCDSISITDKGVGLSPERMYSLFSLGFSTKRNTNKGALGGFGLGAKSPLSTGIDYFTIESCYNGKKLIANCYNHKTDMVIGKFAEDGKQNKEYSFHLKGNDVTFYYEEVECQNYTKITIPSKKINRDKYEQAIKSQLLYFSNIDFNVIDEVDNSNKIPFKATIIYNSKNIILSDNSYYAKPHILIVKDEDSAEAICYGYVDFREMEMQELFSSVGIKCTFRSVIRDPETGEEQVLQEGVSVTPRHKSN
jgi:hypothetical protein